MDVSISNRDFVKLKSNDNILVQKEIILASIKLKLLYNESKDYLYLNIPSNLLEKVIDYLHYKYKVDVLKLENIKEPSFDDEKYVDTFIN